MSRLATAARLLRGDAVPFLAPAWGPEEHAAVDRWRRGEDFDGAPQELERAVAARLGGAVLVRATS